MKTYLLLILLMVSSVFGGIKKSEPLPDITAEVQLYNDKEDVALQPFVEAVVGQTIGFKIDKHVKVAVLEQRIKTDTNGLLLVGTFIKHSNAGFVFEFQPLPDKSVFITGVIFFDDQNIYYTLELNKQTSTIYFQERSSVDGSPVAKK